MGRSSPPFLRDPLTDLVSRRTSADFVFAFLIGIAALLLLMFAWRTSDKVAELRGAARDNTLWSLAQLDVELLALDNAIERARLDGPDGQADVRSRFDVFFSRVRMTDELAGAGGHVSPRGREALSRLRERTERLAEIVGGAGDLESRLADLDADLVGLRPLVRRVSLSGVVQSAAATDEERGQLVGLLVRTAAVDALLICGLGATLAVLYRQILISRRNAEELRRGNDRNAKTIEASLDAIIVADSQGVVLDFNPAAAEMFGYRGEEALGRPMDALIVPSRLRRRYRIGMARLRRTGAGAMAGGARAETTAMRSDGSEFPVELSLAAATGAGGPIVIGFARDISKRIETERALETARDEALAVSEAKSRFVAVMSHEMRTPLNGVVGTLDLLRATPLSRAQANLVETAMTSAEILNQRVDEVLDTSRIQANMLVLVPSAFDFAHLLADVQRVTAAAAKARGNRVSIDASPALPVFFADRKRLQQVVLNLVANAIKFTRDGDIRIHAREAGTGSGLATLEVSVSDTGIGVPEDQLERIFEDFVTLDASYHRTAEGTGLGLPICRNIVRLMGGHIGVESRVGHGSRFWFRVPLPVAGAPDEPEPAPLAVEAQGAEMSPRSLRALVVEDIETNRMVVKQMLQDHGCEVILAFDGEEGVARAEQETFDVILMDISMPGVDGVEATRRVRSSATARSRQTPIFALTAHALPHEHASFMAAGMQGCLAKPIRSHKIKNLVAEIRRESRSAVDEARRGGEASRAAAAPPAPSIPIAFGERLG
jgi:PAS domain S-box-containing protein